MELFVLRGDNQIRTGGWRFCRPLPYQLGYVADDSKLIKANVNPKHNIQSNLQLAPYQNKRRYQNLPRKDH